MFGMYTSHPLSTSKLPGTFALLAIWAMHCTHTQSTLSHFSAQKMNNLIHVNYFSRKAQKHSLKSLQVVLASTWKPCHHILRRHLLPFLISKKMNSMVVLARTWPPMTFQATHFLQGHLLPVFLSTCVFSSGTAERLPQCWLIYGCRTTSSQVGCHFLSSETTAYMYFSDYPCHRLLDGCHTTSNQVGHNFLSSETTAYFGDYLVIGS